MKALVKRSFQDKRNEGKAREAGEVFELAEERFAEIDRKLPGYIVEVVEEKATADGRDAAQGDPESEQHADPEPEPETEPEPEADPDPEDVKAKAKAPANKSSNASNK